MQRTLDAAGGMRVGQGIDDLDGAGEQHRMSAKTSGMGQRGHEMTLAEPGARDEHDVGVLLDEIQMEEVLDKQAVDFGGPVPVKLIQRLEHGEARLSNAALHAAIFKSSHLTAEQLR